MVDSTVELDIIDWIKLDKTIDSSKNSSYETDEHGCFKHFPLKDTYTGPFPNNNLDPQINFKSYETNKFGNLVDDENNYTGPRINKTSKAIEAIGLDKAEQAKRLKILENRFKKWSKSFMKGYYTTKIKTN